MDDDPWVPDEAEERAFTAVYGRWAPLSVAELRDVMAGFPEPWWLVGGHAIEAFTGVQRVHEDIDMVVFSDAVPALRAQLAEFHLWNNAGGTFRVINDDQPELLDPISQIWVRRDASSPWLVDIILNPVVDGRWVSKRDSSMVADLREVTWVADDGVRYMNPEMVMFHKALRPREKDLWDLKRVLPLLSGERRSWLAEKVRAMYPGHAWQPLLDAPPG